jgi:diguanylate cyclase (GGDEF)-like protein/PAS domain S-box-containing protein
VYLQWLSISASRDAGGQVRNYVGVFSDITERKKAEAAREEALSRLQKIASRVPGLVFQFRLRPDGSCCLPYASEAIRDIFRVGPDEVRDDAAPLFAAVHPDDLPAHLASIAASARDLSPWHQEYRLKFEGESDIWLLGNSTPQREADGSVLWHGFVTDITKHKHAEESLRVAATAFESQEGMIVTDAGGTILRVNRAFTEITGYAPEDAVGEKMSLLKSGRHDADFYAAMWDGIQRHGSWQGEVWNRRKNGEVYAEWLTITAVKDTAGHITHYVGTLTDITLRKAAEDEIKHLAFYDPLTRLPNRRLLLDRLQQALASSARSGRTGALLFIDLDNFKTLNDTLGHDVGDLLLQQVAQRLATCVRADDTVARLGGDEFVVMLEDLSDNRREAATQTEVVGEKILATLNQRYLLAGHQHRSTPSIGVTLFGGQRETVEELLKRADLAMYQAKGAGRNAVRFFDPEMQAAVIARAALEVDLRQGLQQNRFLLYYQSQVDADGRMTGVEALLRWQHPQRGMVSPADFIPVAEETGLILQLGHWVLETACAQLVTWAVQAEMCHLTMAVNVSARQFRHPDFVGQVLAVLESSGADPQKLKLELTESLLLDDVEDTIEKMTALKARGVGFALDDFGTGYSSLSYLKRLPLDQLKIDQYFVRNVLTDPNDAAIARTIVALAHSMDLAVIAEGVETEEQRDFLARQGCHAFQGYLFGRPQPVEQFGLAAAGSRQFKVQ